MKVNRIICADSYKYLQKLPDKCIDIVLTSPPYNFNMEYDNTNDNKSWKKYFKTLFRIFDECVRVLKDGGRFIVNIQPLFSDYIPTHHIISHYLQKSLLWKGEILWEKNNYNCKYTAWGSWKSPASPYLKYTWEFIEVFCKSDLKKIGSSKDIDITSNEFKKWVYAKWSIAPQKNEFDHPAMFPEELVRRLLRLFSYRNDIILDPFNGCGTTSLAAYKLHRKYIGIDISEKYCNIAKERLKNAIQENVLFDPNIIASKEAILELANKCYCSNKKEAMLNINKLKKNLISFDKEYFSEIIEMLSTVKKKQDVKHIISKLEKI